MKAHTTSGIFRLPRRLPDETALRQMAAELFFSHERVVIEALDMGIDLSRDALRPIPSDERRMVASDALRVTVYGEDPSELMGHVTQALRLKSPRRRQSITEREVVAFVKDVAERPQAYSRSILEAQAHHWGRAALPHLNGIKAWESDAVLDAADYMISSIRRLIGLDEGRPPFPNKPALPFAAQMLAAHASMGQSGWPLRGMLPSHAVMHIISRREVSTDWRKHDFIDAVVHDALRGAVMMRWPMWPASDGLYARHASRASIRPTTTVSSLGEIFGAQPVELRTPANRKATHDDLFMLLRAARFLTGSDLMAKLPSVTKTSWWRLRIDPMSEVGHRAFTHQISSELRIWDGALRLFTPDRLMRVSDGAIMKFSFPHCAQTLKGVWGVVCEARETDDLCAVRSLVNARLAPFGKRLAAMPYTVPGIAMR